MAVHITSAEDMEYAGMPANTTPSGQTMDLTIETGVTGGKTNGDR